MTAPGPELPSETVAKGMRERKRQRTREAILQAARELFLEKGYQETSLAEIAERADIATSTLPGYFPTKADILFDGINEILSDYIACITSRDRQTESAIEATTRWHEAWAAEMRAGDMEWAYQVGRIIKGDPILEGQHRQRWEPGAEALAREIAAELGDSPASLRPRLIAAIKVTVYVALSEYAFSNAATTEECVALVRAWNGYINECLRAAAETIEDVPLPFENEDTIPLKEASA
jgi:AcrR family transcriptional regulator